MGGGFGGDALGDGSGGVDPDDGDEGGDAKGEMGVGEGEGDGDEVEGERDPVLDLGEGVVLIECSGLAEAADDGDAEEEEGESGDDHGGGVEGDGEGVEVFFEQVGGEEGEQREAEEEGEVGVEDGLIGLAGTVDEVVVVYPVNACKREGEGVDGEGGEDGAESGEAIGVGDFEFEDHDGDDDGDDSVGEGFEAGWGADEMGHRSPDAEGVAAGYNEGGRGGTVVVV